MNLFEENRGLMFYLTREISRQCVDVITSAGQFDHEFWIYLIFPLEKVVLNDMGAYMLPLGVSSRFPCRVPVQRISDKDFSFR